MANYFQYLQVVFVFLNIIASLEIQFSEGRQLKAVDQQHDHDQLITTSDHDILHAKGFQSTTPAGHSLGAPKNNDDNDNDNDKMHRPMMQESFSSTAGQKDDFKGPGHSPGIGHSFLPNYP